MCLYRYCYSYRYRYIPKNHSVPQHDVVVLRCSTDSGRWILLQPLEIPHQSLPSWRRHGSRDLSLYEQWKHEYRYRCRYWYRERKQQIWENLRKGHLRVEREELWIVTFRGSSFVYNRSSSCKSLCQCWIIENF